MEVRVEEEEGLECTRCLDFQNEIKLLESKNLNLEGEVSDLKRKSDELENWDIVDEDEVTRLKIENKVLECEKKKAESDVQVWKAKCVKLEMELDRMRKGMDLSGIDSGKRNEVVGEDEDRSAGTLRMGTPSTRGTDSEQGSREVVRSGPRKRIKLAYEGSRQKSTSPTTPRSSAVTPDVKSDSDCDLNGLQGKKRKFAVTSDSETDEDDVPLSELKKTNRPDVDGDTVPNSNLNDLSSPENRRRSTRKRRFIKQGNRANSNLNDSSSPENHRRSTRKRRLIKQGNRDKEKCAENSCRRKSARIAKLKNVISDEGGSEEDESETESRDSFIVSDNADVSEPDSASNSEEVPAKDDTSSVNHSGDSGNESEGTIDDYGELMSRFRRKKRDKLKWEYQSDMLADLAESPELCMKGVCAVYRRQTSDEKSSKTTFVENGRGFSYVHAPRGSELAEFLTGGDSKGDVIKTVDELLEFKPNGVEQCRSLSTHYSRQLFEIYENEEDPYFRP